MMQFNDRIFNEETNSGVVLAFAAEGVALAQEGKIAGVKASDKPINSNGRHKRRATTSGAKHVELEVTNVGNEVCEQQDMVMEEELPGDTPGRVEMALRILELEMARGREDPRTRRFDFVFSQIFPQVPEGPLKYEQCFDLLNEIMANFNWISWKCQNQLGIQSATPLYKACVVKFKSMITARALSTLYNLQQNSVLTETQWAAVMSQLYSVFSRNKDLLEQLLSCTDVRDENDTRGIKKRSQRVMRFLVGACYDPYLPRRMSDRVIKKYRHDLMVLDMKYVKAQFNIWESLDWLAATACLDNFNYACVEDNTNSYRQGSYRISRELWNELIEIDMRHLGGVPDGNNGEISVIRGDMNDVVKQAMMYMNSPTVFMCDESIESAKLICEMVSRWGNAIMNDYAFNTEKLLFMNNEQHGKIAAFVSMMERLDHILALLGRVWKHFPEYNEVFTAIRESYCVRYHEFKARHDLNEEEDESNLWRKRKHQNIRGIRSFGQ